MTPTELYTQLFKAMIRIGKAGVALGQSGTLHAQASAIVTALAEQVGAVASERASMTTLAVAIEAAAAHHAGKLSGSEDYWVAVNTAGLCHEWISIHDDLQAARAVYESVRQRFDRMHILATRITELSVSAFRAQEFFSAPAI